MNFCKDYSDYEDCVFIIDPLAAQSLLNQSQNLFIHCLFSFPSFFACVLVSESGGHSAAQVSSELTPGPWPQAHGNPRLSPQSIRIKGMSHHTHLTVPSSISFINVVSAL